jgi:cyclic pyranopterin phosphate synthase
MEMTPKEIGKIVEVASELGIRKIKVTGGEPLIRDDIAEIIQQISPYVDEVSMTTNGSMLSQLAGSLKMAGLTRVNVSYHSMRRDVFQFITYTDMLPRVEEGIMVAIEHGLTPVKLNVVVLKGVNDNEIPEMLRFSSETGTMLQLIEYQALEKGVGDWEKYYYDLTPLEDSWGRQATKIVEREMQHRRQYTLPDGAVVEVVRPMHNTVFCANCNRLRLTSDGKLKPCLMRDDNLVPLVELIRENVSKERLIEAFVEATYNREPFWRGNI